MSIDLKNEAKIIPYENKFDFLLSKSETELHEFLKCLFDKTEDKALSEITHANDEFGRDLVIKRQDPYGEIFTGVIVKKGNKSGKVTGDVDSIITDIITQGNMAITHPCTLREIAVGSVIINSIFVVFVGKLTSHAGRRIERELKIASARLIPVAVLIDMLTEYCPEIFFGGDDVGYVQDRINKLESGREFPTKSMPLSTSFVDPYVTKIGTEADLADAFMNGFYIKKLPFQKLEEIVGSGKRILLVGDPGTGKSTALEKIALDMYLKYLGEKIERREKNNIEIPILLKAKDIPSSDIDKIIEDQLPTDKLRDKITVKVLLVDGLDEVLIEKRAETIKKQKYFAHSIHVD